MESGNFISLSNLRKILLELPAVNALQVSKAVALREGFEGRGSESPSVQEISYLDVALMDLMIRYGEVNDHLMGKVHKYAEKLHCPDSDEFVVLDDFHPEIQLSMLVERARGIRSMDIGRGADVFCAAFVDEGDVQFKSTSTDRRPSLDGECISIGSGFGGRLFQTNILRGTSEVDWTWNQVIVGD